MLRRFLIVIAFMGLIVFNFYPSLSAEDNIEETGKSTPIVWVHHSLDWWDWWWNENCSNKIIQPTFGFLPTLTFNYNGYGFKESMEKVNMVIHQQRQAGFKAIPTFNTHIHRGYENGNEFQSWFDRNAWAERAAWVESMVPLAYNNKMALDIEPYWKNESSQRYPTKRDSEKLSIAIKPFIDVLVKNRIKLYVFPAEDTEPWTEIASNMGADIVALYESSYSLPDYYESDEEAYDDLLEEMAEQRKKVEAAGMRYVPGFFETALKKLGFLETMAKLGYHEVWVYIRRDPDVHKYNKLCLPEFYDLEPYNFK